ncbi:MAG: lipase [Chitinophagaceae bacterium]
MNRILFPVLVFASLFFLSCKKEKGNDQQSLPAQTYLNVAYGNDPAQKMDVYLPAGRTTATTKVMVMIHGGAWSSGDKTDFNAYVDTIKRRQPDYAIFNLNYRLSTGTTNTFPAQENDVKAALSFIVNKLSEYNISDKIVLLGASAGGHLAMLQAYKYTTPIKVKAVVDFFGPTDMNDLYNNPLLVPPATVALIVGATPTSNPTLYQQSSPINFVSSQSPPTIVFQGGADPLVSATTQTAPLVAKLQLMGVVNQLVFYPTEGHGWVGANLTDSFNKLQAFLAANVN